MSNITKRGIQERESSGAKETERERASMSLVLIRRANCKI